MIWHHVDHISIDSATNLQITLSLVLSDGQKARLEIAPKADPDVLPPSLFPTCAANGPSRTSGCDRAPTQAKVSTVSAAGPMRSATAAKSVRCSRKSMLESKATKSASRFRSLSAPAAGDFVESRRPGVFAVASKQADLVETTFGTSDDSKKWPALPPADRCRAPALCFRAITKSRGNRCCQRRGRSVRGFGAMKKTKRSSKTI